MQHHRTQIVDPVGLVGMLMGQEHRVDVVDVGVDQLLAQIGRGIDHDPRDAVIRCPLGEQRTAAAAVFRIVGIACAPAQRRTRNAGGGSAAENGQGQRHATASARRHFAEQAEEIFRGLARNLLQRNAARFRQHLGDFDHIGRLVALAAKFAGRQIRRVGLDHDAIGRQARRRDRASVCDFLKVRMPVNEIERPKEIAFIASSRPPV